MSKVPHRTDSSRRSDDLSAAFRAAQAKIGVVSSSHGSERLDDVLSRNASAVGGATKRPASLLTPSLILQITELCNTDLPAAIVLQRLLEAALRLVPCDRISFFIPHQAAAGAEPAAESLACSVTHAPHMYVAADEGGATLHASSTSVQVVASALVPYVGLTVPIGAGFLSFAFKTGQPVRINQDLTRDWRFDSVADKRPEMTVRSLLCLPVV